MESSLAFRIVSGNIIKTFMRANEILFLYKVTIKFLTT